MSIETLVLDVPFTETKEAQTEVLTGLDTKAIATEILNEFQPIDYKTMYDQKKAECDRLNSVLETQRNASRPAANKSVQPVITADRFRSLAGPTAFLKMTRSEKLLGIGADPNLEDSFLKRIFGRGADSAIGSDLMRSDPRKYALLKQAALVTGAYGN